MTLVEFLLDRIAEDEKAAVTYVIEVAPDRPLPPLEFNGLTWNIAGEPPGMSEDDLTTYLLANYGQTEKRDERLLRECTAKRALVRYVGRWQRDGALLPNARTILGLLAATYAEHPDYDPAWTDSTVLATEPA